ncbi:MAG: hypothetical protein JW974_01850 [Alphaproteobacteria bacterium]|nr:hypothetical protein [Alphaproteobacteria bacterium]MBN2675523.1 hypothetical protein [Alphaproteobacteria bacterium]
MKHTSAANIRKILEFNRCESIEQLNSSETVHLNVVDLNGYINLADFTKGALKIYFSGTNKELKDLYDRYYNNEKDEKVLAKVKQMNRKVDLDASYAGEFAYWFFRNDFEHYFINSVKLRHPNQVFHFGNPGFCVQNGNLRKMIDNAKIAARYRNIKKHLLNKNNTEFHDDIINLLYSYSGIQNDKKYIDELLLKVNELKLKIDEKQKQIKIKKGHITEQLDEIKGKKDFLGFSEIEEILPINFETKTLTNNDSGDQIFDYHVLSMSSIEIMKKRNSMWYNKITQKSK